MTNIDENDDYFWIRIYDYIYERDMSSNSKGTMLDEFYIKTTNGRDFVKNEVLERYGNQAANKLKFARPKKKDGIYAIILDSTKMFHDRFYTEIETYCFHCHKPIKGRGFEFPRWYIGERNWFELERDSSYNEYLPSSENVFFCNSNCKSTCQRSITHEGEFQMKEEGFNGNVFGYVYQIYNRAENKYYVGQTRYMPFFRWQEHVKAGQKGDISDLSFSVLAEVYNQRYEGKSTKENEEQNQIYLNNIEAWWISKYKEENYDTVNITKPKITIPYLKELFEDMVLKQDKLLLD